MSELVDKNNNQSKRSSDSEDSAQLSKKPRVSGDSSISLTSQYMPMKDFSKKVKRSFKSPLADSSSKTVNVRHYRALTVRNADLSKVREDIERMKQELASCDEELAKLNAEDYQVDYLDQVISKLHDYNEVKDTTQSLLERMAHLKNTTIKQMHVEYGIDIETD